MSTVTFSNGKTVNFNGTPTPDDVDYVAKQIGIQPQQSSSLGSDVLGAGKWLANAVAGPAESLGTHLGEGEASLTADALDNIDPQESAHIRQNLKKPLTTMTGGQVSPLKPGLGGALQLGGDALSTGVSAIAPGDMGVLKGAGLGAASGLGQGLSTGDTNLSNLGQDTAAGGIFGGVLGGVSSGLGHVSNALKGATGISPQIENELSKVAPSAVDKYASAAIAHESDVSTPTAFNVAEKEFDNRASILTDKLLPQAGEALGQARDAGAKIPVMLKPQGAPPVAGVNAVDTISDGINNVMQKLTGHQMTQYGSAEDLGFKVSNYPQGPSTSGLNGAEGIVPLPGRSIDLSTSETKQLANIADQLTKLRENPTVQTAIDVKTNLNTDIGNWKNPQFGSPNSPVQGVLKYAYGQVSSLISNASPEIGAATDKYAQLAQLKDAISSQAGSDGQSASLMMRRVLSGDKSSTVIPVLQQLDQVTAPYRPANDPSLVTQSVLSSWATKNFGGESGKTLLNQYTSEGSSIFGYARSAVNNVLKETFKFLTPDRLEYAKSIAAGNPESLNLVTRLAQKVMDSSEAVPLLGKITESLNSHGINPNTAGPILEKVIQTAILNKLSAPNNQK